MGHIGKLITTMSNRTDGLAEALAKGIEPANAARLPQVDGKPVRCNHPTFVYGHLAIYPQKLMMVMGATDLGETLVPEGYEALFEAGCECLDDPDGSIYPPLREVLDYFTAAHTAVVVKIRETDDDVFASAIEGNERAAGFFGTVDAMCLFMLHDHRMFHLGQISTWRRVMGLGSAV